jgi:hypothetical protein
MTSYVDPLGGDPDGVLEAISRTAAGQSKPVVGCVVNAEGELPTDGSLHVPNFRFPSPAQTFSRARPSDAHGYHDQSESRPTTVISIQWPPAS